VPAASSAGLVSLEPELSRARTWPAWTGSVCRLVGRGFRGHVVLMTIVYFLVVWYAGFGLRGADAATGVTAAGVWATEDWRKGAAIWAALCSRLRCCSFLNLVVNLLAMHGDIAGRRCRVLIMSPSTRNDFHDDPSVNDDASPALRERMSIMK